VVEVNEGLKSHPESVNGDPHASWMIRVRVEVPADVDGLLTASQYEGLLG
jgi:glycine cleavage system H protein